MAWRATTWREFKEQARIALTSKPEHERFSKVQNLIEGLVLYVLVVFLTYRLIFPGYTLPEAIIKNAIIGYMFILGPILHRNSTSDLGIGNPRRLREELFSRKHPGQITVAIALIGLSILVFPLYLREFDAILKLVPFFGFLNDIIAEHVPWLGLPVAIVEYVLFQVFVVLLLIRKDNLKASFTFIARPLLVIAGLVLLVSLVTGDMFRVDVEPLTFLATWYGYIFYGLAQQVPFLLYFSTRFRKGFPFHRASEYVNVALIVFFFGFFHAPNWPLVVFASLMEVVVAWMYLRDETRNLFVAAILHSFLGTLVIFFTGLLVYQTTIIA